MLPNEMQVGEVGSSSQHISVGFWLFFFFFNGYLHRGDEELHLVIAQIRVFVNASSVLCSISFE